MFKYCTQRFGFLRNAANSNFGKVLVIVADPNNLPNFGGKIIRASLRDSPVSLLGKFEELGLINRDLCYPVESNWIHLQCIFPYCEKKITNKRSADYFVDLVGSKSR